MFNTPYNMTKKTPPEINSGELKVDSLGYMPAKKRIENMMLAGQRLKDYRQSTYDFPDGKIDTKYQNPQRSLNYDLADAFQDGLQIDAKLSSQDAAAKQAAAEQIAAQDEAAKASQAEYEAWKASQNTQVDV